MRKTFPVYEEVEGLQVLPHSEEYADKFPVASGGGRTGGGNLVAVAGKNGVVRVFALEGALLEAALEAPEEGEAEKKKKKIKKAARDGGGGDGGGNKKAQQQQQRLTCRCVMTQDNASASHRAGYTSLLLDPRHGGLLAVTSDHNVVLMEAAAGNGRPLAGGAVGSLVTRRQIVGYNDEVIDLKSFPSVAGGGEEGESWVAVATNSPQVRLFELGGFSCRLLDGHTDTVLALDVAPDG